MSGTRPCVPNCKLAKRRGKITGPAENGYSVQEYKRIKLPEYDLEMRITWGDKDLKGLRNCTVTFDPSSTV
ncbi:hypothetical protein GCM10010965_20420 [Caldalkalibacillus thermarum]|nr:hypothetical protein GCM10010965_20420 [Caldalkalibacillus thermarum]